MFFSWESEEDFELWHNEIMDKLGIPNEQTQKYTELQMDGDGRLFAKVLEAHVELSNLIGQPIEPTVIPSIVIPE